MAESAMATYNPQMMPRGPFTQVTAGVAPVPNVPPGTFLPGTKVQVGSHRVIIDRYLSEGGFAHVYVVTLQKPIDGEEKAVLKRVAVPDKGHLASMRTEVETMKRLRGHKYIVKYFDSHASPLKAGGYEVFLLMEFCSGGGLIDFMNTRLQNRLTEPEILKIFTDITEGVACMHYLKPPLLHRDLKIENVLISSSGKDKIFKLCDFGSTAPARPAATTAAEGRAIEEDIQQHTTLQYRSPEMIDVYRKHPIDEKSDIWALGCFLYKLCYYTTPFEEAGQMAILNASFKYPGYPKFSDQLKLLIATMLREQPSQRPNIYQVLQKACQLDKRECTIKDIYADRSRSEKRPTKVLPDNSDAQSRSGASLAPPKKEVSQNIPDIAPMRRGRPTVPTSHHNSAKPSPSPLRMIESTDPFAKLDGNKIAAGDELSSKFPTLDQFSLLTDKSSNFAFQTDLQTSSNGKDENLSKRVTDALADDAFVRSPSPERTRLNISTKAGTNRSTVINARKPAEAEGLSTKVSITGPTDPTGPTVPRKPVIVTAGTATPPTRSPSIPQISDRPVWKVPNSERSSSTGPASQSNRAPRPAIASSGSGSRLASLLQQDAAQSQPGDGQVPKSASSARPSMDGGRPPLPEFDSDVSVGRSRSLNLRARPVSVNLGAGLTHVKDREFKKSDLGTRVLDADLRAPEIAVIDSDTNVTSDIEFLRIKEEEEKEKAKHARRGSSRSRHDKRASLPSIALAGTKNILQGRFGDAFKKFEAGDDTTGERANGVVDRETILTPIAGSEATDLSEDQQPFEETENLSPEMRRELEKRGLEAEERRVANAATEYRQRAMAGTNRPPVPSAKASSIQNRVQSLLQDSGRPVQKSATGYGQYTGAPRSIGPPEQGLQSISQQSFAVPQRAKTVAVTSQEPRSISAPASQVNLQRMQRPAAPPKPRVLQTGRAGTMPTTSAFDAPAADAPPFGTSDDWEDQFSKRYPSLSNLEMVETEIDSKPLSQKMTIREI